MLTSSETFSAGEEFAYNLKQIEKPKSLEQKRVILVGETTKGGANPCHPIALSHGLELASPNGEARNAISRTNWEKTGVEPDVAIASDNALEKAKEILLSKIELG